jgi:hypothetical protein
VSPTEENEAKPSETSVAWERLAEPQRDQYDTRVVLQWAQNQGYVRRPVGGDPTTFDGRVAIRSDKIPFQESCIPAPLDHPNMASACELVRTWPTVFAQFQELVDSVYLFLVETQNPGERPSTYSALGTGGPFGSIAATVNDPVGLAESLVHEMAHHKLRVLGIHPESADRIIGNPRAHKFPSPIRYDRLRPMTAVFHAQYSFTYLTALGIEIARSDRHRTWHERVGSSLAKNLPKLKYGLGVIQAHALWDRPGKAFMEGFQTWSDRVLSEGQQILDQLHISPRPFTHPLEVPVSSSNPREAECPCRQATVREVPQSDELLLYTSTPTPALSLNGPAKAIWELCDGRHTVRAICDELSAIFDCPVEVLLPDVQKAIGQFRALGLLEPVR